jgi:ABC-type multidrug transport system fused ATPase/permease subunit
LIKGEFPLTRRFLRALWPYIKQVSGLMIFGSLGGIVMNTAVVLPAILLGRAIDTATAWNAGQATGADVLQAGLLYVGGMALYQSARLVKRWGLRVGHHRIVASVRADALRGVLAWPFKEFHQIPIGDLMARIIGDVEVMGRGVRELTTETWDTLLFSLSLIIAMLAYNPRLTLLTLLPVPLGMLLAQSIGRWVAARTTASREASAALTAFLQERLTGLRVVRIFGRVDATVAGAGALSDQLATANLAMVRLRSGMQPIYRLLMLVGVVILLWLGGQQVAAGVMTLGGFVAYFELYTRFVNRGHRVPQMFNSVQSGAAAFARLQPLLAPSLEERRTIRSTLSTTYVPGLDQPIPSLPERPPYPTAISVRALTFRYPGNEATVLDRVSLDVPAGAFIAVTGPVGCGKSALARVLLGLYPLEKGQILLNGEPLTCLSPADRAAQIGYLPQNPFLFSGTVNDNIKMTLSDLGDYGCADDDLIHWVHLAALDSDVETFPDGLNTEIGERGSRISGGQRQRIALARAFATCPGLLVLDDPFSAVDLDTEAKIVAGIHHTYGPAAPVDQQATVIFFSHRLAAFPLAERVVVLDSGRIVEQGTHDELLSSGDLYARIYRAQQRVAAKGWIE